MLGQFDFVSNQVLVQPGGGNPQNYAQSLAAPTALAFDASGRDVRDHRDGLHVRNPESW